MTAKEALALLEPIEQHFAGTYNKNRSKERVPLMRAVARLSEVITFLREKDRREDI